MRGMPVEDGGRGADQDVLKRRVEVDREASHGFNILSWPDVARGCFYWGLPAAQVYITVLSLTGGEPYLVPDHLKREHGKVIVKPSAMGVSSEELVLDCTTLLRATWPDISDALVSR